MKDALAPVGAPAPPRADRLGAVRRPLRREEACVQYLGIDWGIRRAAWCALDEHGTVMEGAVAADADGLARLALQLGPEVRGCVEMMSGAVWVRDQLSRCGWAIEIADARKVKAIAPLACKTDRVDARVLAELVRRDLVPSVWVPSLDERAIRERLRRRMHLVRLRTSAINRTFGLLTQWGLRRSLTCASPTRSRRSASTASRRSGGSRSPRCWGSSMTSTASWPRSSRSCARWPAATTAPSCR